MNLSPNIAAIQPSATIAVSTLARQLRAEGRDVIDLSAGEPDFSTPEWITAAAVRALASGATRYTPTAGLPELRDAIADWLDDRALAPVDPAGVVVSCGAKQALFNTCFRLFGSDDEVLIATPYWTSYPEIVRLARATPVFVRGAEADAFRLTPADLQRALTPRTRGLIICTPSNPTGAVYRSSEIEALVRWTGERGLWLISDEIYGRICFSDGGQAPSVLELEPQLRDRVVLVDGLSKAFAMTGWRIGFSCCRPDLAARMTAMQSHVTSNAATPSQHAALAALRDRGRAEAALAEMVPAYRKRRDLVLGLMAELLPSIRPLVPEGAFYLFFRVDGCFDAAAPDSISLCRRVLDEAAVALVPGAAFGDDRFARLSFAQSETVLREGIRRLAGVLRSAELPL